MVEIGGLRYIDMEDQVLPAFGRARCSGHHQPEPPAGDCCTGGLKHSTGRGSGRVGGIVASNFAGGGGGSSLGAGGG